MQLQTTAPVRVIDLGIYQDNGKNMVRRDGSPIEFVTVLATDSAPGELPTTFPLQAGVSLNGIAAGDLVDLTVHTRTEARPATSRNGNAYVAYPVKNRVTGLKVAVGAGK